MKCNETKEFFEEYIAGELNDDMKNTIETHVESCPNCKKELEELKNSIVGIRDAYQRINIPKALDNIVVKQDKKKNKWFSYKKVIAIAACVVTIFTATFTTVQLLPTNTDIVSADDYRNGYSLTPETVDTTGVKPDSRFVLKSVEKVKLDDLKQNLYIDGEPQPVITKEESDTFVVTPTRALEENKLYTFKIKNESGKDITWAFQTSASFKVVSAFPADKTTEVPTNTGIEIYFSHEEFEDIGQYFEITPAVSGTFERHKKAAVFVPKELKEETLYTVRIKKGLKLTGTNYSLKQDYVFKFETKTKEDIPKNEKGQFNYQKVLNEYSPGEKPYLPIDYYVNQEIYKGKIKAKTVVYGYSSVDSFVDAVNKKDSVPNWAYRSFAKNIIPTNGLNKVLQFEQEFYTIPSGENFIKFPNALPSGFYLIDSKWEDSEFQTFIQVTDIGMYIMKGNNKTLVWLNDLETAKPISGAVMTLLGDNIKCYSDSKGIINFDSISIENNSDSQNSGYPENKYFKIVTKDNKVAVLDYYTYMDIYGDYGQGIYWNFLQLDRNLFKPNDIVNFWGLVKNRYQDEKIDDLTVEINQGYTYYGRAKHIDGDMPLVKWHYTPTQDQPFVKKTVTAENGIFKGNIGLPMLEPGGYQLTLKRGSKAIANTYITIENYTKPPYQLDITKDKKAVLPGQQVNFNIKAGFFEGTGVPNLDVYYNIMNYGVGEEQITSNAVTDSQGNISVKYVPQPGNGVQGEQYVGFNCHAILPEIGETSQDDGVRVFVNDVNVKLITDIKSNKGSITAELNKIVVDRLNNGTAKDDNDYLGDAVAGKTIVGILYKTTWVKVEEGQYYDFINKVTQKRYRYEPKKDILQRFTATTDANGKATFNFDAPKFDGYYSAYISCTDNSNRTMKFDDVYIGSTPRFDWYDDSRYFLDGGKETYNVGDKVDLSFKKGKEILPNGSYLFIKTQNGIREYVLQDSPQYQFDFQEKDIPNVYITGVYFNGLTYVESEQCNLSYNYKEKNLVINATLDKQSYKPGDEVVVNITAKDKGGKPVKAIVNVSLVDEALFKLNDQNIDTLTSLYNGVSPGIEFTYKTHVNSGQEMVRHAPAGMGGDQIKSKEMKSAKVMNGANVKVEFSGAVAADVVATNYSFHTAEAPAPRSDFRDAAYFANVTLNENGQGKMKFNLPDNITAWRVTLSGVTNDLSAGSNKVNLNVTLPFFINYTLNSTYLVGDKPVLGVNAYGNDLKQGDDVVFEVSSSSKPDKVARAQGKAFERINIPLWKLTEGTDNIIIKAQSATGMQDSLKHPIRVVSTYHQMEKAVYYDVTPGMKIEGGSTGNTSLVFSDRSKGAFLPELTNLLYTNGNRIDQKLSAKVAADLILKYFKKNNMGEEDTSFKVTDYQRQDGGIAILPYGNSDADITAKLVSLIKDDVNSQSLKNYFYGILMDDSSGIKGNALYGLAVLKEPVLLNIDKAAKTENASVKDLLYIALAYCELGELPKADRLFNERIAPHIEDYKPVMRINTGKDNDDILECTSLGAIVASKLDKSQKKGLYEYCIKNYTKDILVNIEKLLYISNEIGKYKDGSVKLTYTYQGDKKTKELKDGETHTITLPSQNLSQFKVENVEGDISMVSVFTTGITEVDKTDSNIKVERVYSQSGKASTNFKQNDIIKVTLDWDVLSKAIDGSYEIVDYLPSGLKPIENPYSMGIERVNDFTPFRRIDGQKVTFYVYKEWKEREPLVYYARVINPGTYKAESSIIQGVTSRDSINFGKSDVITIQ